MMRGAAVMRQELPLMLQLPPFNRRYVDWP